RAAARPLCVVAGGRPGKLALEPADLAAQLVAILAGEAREVLVPALGQGQDRAAVLALHARGKAVSGRELGQERGGRRGGADAVEVPRDGLTLAVLEQRGPPLRLAAVRRDQVQVIGDVDPAQDALPLGAVLVERE